MKQYLDLLRHIMAYGNFRGDRTGTGTQSVFGYQNRYDLAEGFPLLTTKKLNFKTIAVELLWFLKGDTNIKYLLENGVHIWTDDALRVYKRKTGDAAIAKETFEKYILEDNLFAMAWGDLGPMYGKQWRAWVTGVKDHNTERGTTTYNKLDQITKVIDMIKSTPEGRRHIVTAWNPAEVDSMALPPCHCLFQFYVADRKLSCQLYQRSADVFLGVPFNIASYALLTHIIAHQTGLGVGTLIHTFGDVHIYNNHRDQVAEQLSREPRSLPRLLMDPDFDRPEIDKYILRDFTITDYNPHPPIKGDLSVGV